MKDERLLQILDYIDQQQVVTIPELCDKFGVSVNTVRRDLDHLKKENKVEKVYGGARSLSNNEKNRNVSLSPYESRIIKHADEKKAVARIAINLISENDVIFIDTGTSTVAMLPYLAEKFNHLTIITNSVYVLYEGLRYSKFTMIALPGILLSKTASLIGEQCLAMLSSYNIQKAFMACSALSIENGVSNSSIEEYAIKKQVLKQSRHAYLLTDSSKFDKTSLMTFARLAEFEAIATESTPPKKYGEFFTTNNIKLLIANDKTGVK